MDEKIVDIKGLSNEDLLALHAKIEEHLKYLDSSIISLDDGTENNDTDEAANSNAKADGGEDDE